MNDTPLSNSELRRISIIVTTTCRSVKERATPENWERFKLGLQLLLDHDFDSHLANEALKKHDESNPPPHDQKEAQR